jgi:hypothetical protein
MLMVQMHSSVLRFITQFMLEETRTMPAASSS